VVVFWARVAPSGKNGPVSKFFSPSAASMWEQCPRKWWYRYVDRLPEPPPGEPLVLGTFVHAVLESLLALPGPDRTPDAARALARSEFDALVDTERWEGLGFDDDQARRFRQRAWATIEAYFAEFTPTEVDPLHQELKVITTIDGVPFIGFIDLVERGGPDGNSVVVTDYKTGKPPDNSTPWAEQDRAERLLQPLWYALALVEKGQYNPAVARLLYFTAVDTSTGDFEPLTGELAAPVTGDALDHARSELVRRWNEIGEARQQGGAEAKPGPLCGWCPFVAHCPEGSEAVRRRWEQRNPATGDRKLRADAPAVELLGLT